MVIIWHVVRKLKNIYLITGEGKNNSNSMYIFYTFWLRQSKLYQKKKHFCIKYYKKKIVWT